MRFALNRFVRLLSPGLACLGLFMSICSAVAQDKPADDKTKPAEKKITYTDHVQAIFREHCYTCHSQDTAKSDLALDSYSATMRGGAGGEVVLAGDLESSRLWALVSHAETPKMPPEQDKLPEAKLSLIKQWIAGGALDNSGSVVKTKPKPKIDLNATAGSSKPTGPAAMPEKQLRQPFVHTARPGAITALASSPWAPLVAVSGQKQIMLYNSDSGALLTILSYPEGVPHVLKFSRSGALLMAGGGQGGKSGKVVVFDVKTGERVVEVGDELDVVLAADINDDHTLIALGGPRKIVRIYSIADGTVQNEIRKHTDWIYALEFSPDGVLLATTDRAGGVFVWEADTAREFQNLTGHSGGVSDVSWRLDGNLLATSGDDGTIRLWELENGTQVKNWQAHGGGALSVDFGRNGQIASAGRDKTVKIWDQTGKAIATLPAMPDLALEVTFSHDAARVVGGDLTGEVRVWNVADSKEVTRLSANPPTLEMALKMETERAASAQAAAQTAQNDLVAATKAAMGQTTAADNAAKQFAAAQAAAAKAEADRLAAEKAAPQKAAAAKTAKDKYAAAMKDVGKARSESEVATNAVQKEATQVTRVTAQANEAKVAADKLTTELAAATKLVNNKQTAFSAAEQAKDEEGQKKLKAELTGAEKDLADKKGQAETAAKNLATKASDADKARAAQAAAEKVAQDKAAALKIATEKSNAAKSEADRAEAENVAAQKAVPATAAASKNAAAAVLVAKTAMEKQSAAKDAANKLVADKTAAAKTAADSAAAAKASAERAAADKAAFDKAGTAQASTTK